MASNGHFLKQQPEDLRRLYGLEVTEEIVWLPLLETVESGPSRGVLHTVEVDSWWLPDTAGTAYHSDHVKTSIVPSRVDRGLRLMWYIHGAGPGNRSRRVPALPLLAGSVSQPTSVIRSCGGPTATGPQNPSAP